MPIIPGDGGSNTLTGSSADDTILGFGGDDTLIGNGGRDSLDGGAGFDTADFTGTAGDLDVDLAAGVERAVTNSALISVEAVTGAGGDDALAGDAGANRLDGCDGDDSISGRDGSDTLIGGTGGNVLDGGAGRDTADYGWAAGSVLVNLADASAEVDDLAGPLPAAVDALLDIEDAVGGAGDDTLIGDGGANALSGAGGDDSVSGGGGDDTLAAGQGRDTLDGGAGRDTADFSGAAGDLDVDLAAGVERAVTNSVLVSIEAVSGAGGDDAIAGDAGNNTLDGRDGDDSINGRDGDDTVVGGTGGNVLDGGAGRDTADYGWAAGGVLVNLADSFAEVDDPAGAAPAAVDTLSSIENVLGGSGSDTLRGDANANALSGAGGNDIISGGAGDDSLDGGTGTDTAVFAGRRADFAAALFTEVSAGDGFVVSDARVGGGEGADTVTGVEFFAFDDGIVSASDLVDAPPPPPPPPPDPGTDPVRTFFGTPGDDRLSFFPGNEIIDGLGGRDWLDMLAEGRRGSVVSAQSDGTVAVIHAGQTDAIVNVEEIRFADGRLVFDAGDPAAQVVRLYEAALDRLPDQGGLNFWIDAVQDGRSLSELAQGFLGSGEFRARFGEVADNGAFVDQLYFNVLGRAGEAGGRDFWVGSLNNGTARADVLVAFSESAENKAGTAALVQGGIWDRSEAAAEVARLYDTVLGRAPDVGGLTFWKDGLEGGAATLDQMADAFTGSAEFLAKYGSLGNRDFAEALYVNTLDRPAEQAGLDFWIGQLDAGVARSAVVLAFSESPEHVALTANGIQSENPSEFGILFA